MTQIGGTATLDRVIIERNGFHATRLLSLPQGTCTNAVGTMTYWASRSALWPSDKKAQCVQARQRTETATRRELRAQR